MAIQSGQFFCPLPGAGNLILDIRESDFSWITKKKCVCNEKNLGTAKN